jgi:hypothetical protein
MNIIVTLLEELNLFVSAVMITYCAHRVVSEYALFDARIRDLREQLNTSNVPASSSKVATKHSLYVR